MKLEALILQDIATTETRAALSGTMLLDHSVTVLRSSLAGLSDSRIKDVLQSGAGLPVGSVEFIREAMRLCGIDEPVNMSYPPVLTDYLCREVHRVSAGQVLGTWFVKPCATKSFTGFVFNTLSDPDSLNEHDRIQYDVFMALPAEDPVWISEPVEFVCEWRYYVMDSKVIGSARYDPDGADEEMPDQEIVASSVLAMGPGAYVLDFGVLSTGETALVEANDAWAIGLYERALSPRDYLGFLGARWGELQATKPELQLQGGVSGLEAKVGRRARRP